MAPRRSHAILTVHLTTRTACGASGDHPDRSGDQQIAEEAQVGGGPKVGRGGRGERVTASKLNLVDLAGSEKSSVVSSAAAGDAAMLHREGRFINKSLAFLEQVRRSFFVQLRSLSGRGSKWGGAWWRFNFGKKHTFFDERLRRVATTHPPSSCVRVPLRATFTLLACLRASDAFSLQVTIALADRKREHIPFRCSKLTQFLKVNIRRRPEASLRRTIRI